MSDDTPEELKKFRPKLTVTSGEPIEIAPPYLVEAVPVCRVETWSDGRRFYKEEHEPDEELENLPQTKGKVNAFMTVSNNKEPALRVRVRICKHCKCLYAEKK